MLVQSVGKILYRLLSEPGAFCFVFIIYLQLSFCFFDVFKIIHEKKSISFYKFTVPSLKFSFGVFQFAFDPPQLPFSLLTARIMAAVALICRPVGVLPKLSGEFTVRLVYHTHSVTVYELLWLRLLSERLIKRFDGV